MKLKNKQTGEIKDWDFGNWYQTILNPENKEKYECNLNDFIDRTVKFREVWKDYEEPKEYWYVSCDGKVLKANTDEDDYDEEHDSGHKEIGNYFDTREEAEKAVEKLKAWKRLEDKGFKFCGHDDRDRGQLGDIVIYAEMPTFEYDDDSTRDDLDLLFGGEE